MHIRYEEELTDSSGPKTVAAGLIIGEVVVTSTDARWVGAWVRGRAAHKDCCRGQARVPAHTTSLSHHMHTDGVKGCTSCPCTCMAFSPFSLLPLRRWIPEFVRDADVLHKLLSVSGVAFYLDESRGKRSTPASIASAAAAGSVAASPYVCLAGSTPVP